MPRTGRKSAPRRAPAEPQGTGEKLHKVLAEQGLGGRREMERWITDGRIKVDGEVAHLGQRVFEDAVIQVDGKRLRTRWVEQHRVLVLNKSAGTVCTRRDPERRKTIFAGLPELKNGRWVSVGRLDIQTSGMLLVTNHGALAHKLMHPSTGLDREYAVRIEGKLEEEQEQQLKDGVMIEGLTMRFSDVRYYRGSGRNHWYHVVLMEGRNHEVRRLFDAVGHPVSRLKRVRYGPVVLPSSLTVGRYAEMSRDDLTELYKLLGLRLHHGSRSVERAQKNARKSPSMLLPYPSLKSREAQAVKSHRSS